MINLDQVERLSEDTRMMYAQHPDMARKVRVTLSINEKLRQLAEEFGLNLSAFLEIKLHEHFREFVLMNSWCGGRDLNPRTPTGRDPKSRAFDLTRQPPLKGLNDFAILTLSIKT